MSIFNLLLTTSCLLLVVYSSARSFSFLSYVRSRGLEQPMTVENVVVLFTTTFLTFITVVYPPSAVILRGFGVMLGIYIKRKARKQSRNMTPLEEKILLAFLEVPTDDRAGRVRSIGWNRWLFRL